MTDIPLSYKKQTIGMATRDGRIVDGIERWHAHETGIMHRAFTVALIYKDHYILQHRRHPVFDGVYDITSSSHQLYNEETKKLQDTITATLQTLDREWNLSETDLLSAPELKGNVYYKAKDQYSIYTEHEVCDIVVAEIKELPKPNFDIAYGYSLIEKSELKNANGRIHSLLAPWVITAMEDHLL